MTLSSQLIALAALAAFSLNVSAAEAPKKGQPAPKKAIPTELGKQVVARYVEMAQASYADALLAAGFLRKQIDAFVKAPSKETHEAAKDAWKKSRDAYSPTEAFRFYGGPVDHPETGPEGLLNAWPLDEAYLDYVKGNPAAGLITQSSAFPKITKELLISMNEKDGEKNISTGYHAIEFLLWGQDLSATGPGERPFTDYIETKTATVSNGGARRGQTLKLMAEILESDLAKVVKAWDAKDKNNYGEQLKKEPLEESLRKIYTGLISLSIDEMAGERMTVSLENNDQENEQDCFSDYTLVDALSNLRGIENVYYGTQGSTKGVGLHDLVMTIDPMQAKKTAAALEKSKKALAAIPGTFDQVILEKKNGKGRKAAMAAISALEDQARAIAKSGLDLGLVLNIQ